MIAFQCQEEQSHYLPQRDQPASIKEEINMKRDLGLKRSFNFEDLSSIVGLGQHAQIEDDSFSNPSRKRVKRQRTISTDLSSCSTLSYCWEEEAEKSMSMMPDKFMYSSAAASNSNDDSLTVKALSSHSVARLITPATSHVVVSPELKPAFQSEGLSSLPCFPSLSKESSDFPATAALENFMLKQKSSVPTLFGSSPFDTSRTTSVRSCGLRLSAHTPSFA